MVQCLHNVDLQWGGKNPSVPLILSHIVMCSATFQPVAANQDQAQRAHLGSHTKFLAFVDAFDGVVIYCLLLSAFVNGAVLAASNLLMEPG